MRWIRFYFSDRLFAGVLFLFAILLMMVGFWFVIELLMKSSLSISRFGLNFLVSPFWNPSHHVFGALVFLYGTIWSSILGLTLATVVGLPTALLLTQFGQTRLVRVFSFFIDLLASIPSVVYGIWGLFVLLPFLKGAQLGAGILAAGLILGIMILPTITKITRQVMSSVPQELQEGALALGATRYEKVKLAILPYSLAGILGAMMLAFGRALGETIAVTMVIGNHPELEPSFLTPGATLASVIANQFSEAKSPMYLSSLYEIGLLLFIVTFIFYGGARALIWRVSKPMRLS